MARTLQTRKRSRYGGNQRPYKRKRVIRRRRNPQATGFNSRATTTTYQKYKGLSYRKRKNWKNKLIRVTDTLQKWKSSSVGSAAISPPNTLTGCTQNSYQIMKATGTDITNPTNFTNYNGGVVSVASAAGGPVCRGGYSELQLAHENTECVWYNVYLCFTKDGIPTDGTYLKTAEPAFGLDGNTAVKMIRKYEGFLPNGEAKVFRFRIPPHRVDYGDFVNKRNCWFWCVQIGNSCSAVITNAVTVIAMEEAWFAGVDVVS